MRARTTHRVWCNASVGCEPGPLVGARTRTRASMNVRPQSLVCGNKQAESRSKDKDNRATHDNKCSTHNAQGRAGQGRAGQGRAGQDRTGQETSTTTCFHHQNREGVIVPKWNAPCQPRSDLRSHFEEVCGAPTVLHRQVCERAHSGPVFSVCVCR